MKHPIVIPIGLFQGFLQEPSRIPIRILLESHRSPTGCLQDYVRIPIGFFSESYQCLAPSTSAVISPLSAPACLAQPLSMSELSAAEVSTVVEAQRLCSQRVPSSSGSGSQRVAASVSRSFAGSSGSGSQQVAVASFHACYQHVHNVTLRQLASSSNIFCNCNHSVCSILVCCTCSQHLHVCLYKSLSSYGISCKIIVQAAIPEAARIRHALPS